LIRSGVAMRGWRLSFFYLHYYTIISLIPINSNSFLKIYLKFLKIF
jgi:hypothetical protein